MPQNYSGFKCWNIYGLLFDFGVRQTTQCCQHSATTQCCQRNATVVTPPVLSAVENRVWRYEIVVHHCRPLRWSRTGGRPASIRSAKFLLHRRSYGEDGSGYSTTPHRSVLALSVSDMAILQSRFGVVTVISVYLRPLLSAVTYSAGDCATSPPLVWPWILDHFCTIFVSFVSRLNRKIRVPRLQLTIRAFCLLKMRQNASKVIILGTKMIVSGEGAQPPPSYPTPSMPTRRAPPNWNSEYIHYTCRNVLRLLACSQRVCVMVRWYLTMRTAFGWHDCRISSAKYRILSMLTCWARSSSWNFYTTPSINQIV